MCKLMVCGIPASAHHRLRQSYEKMADLRVGDARIGPQEPDRAGGLQQFESELDEMRIRAAPLRREAGIEEGDRHLQRFGDPVQPSRAHTIDALLVFLDLLK